MSDYGICGRMLLMPEGRGRMILDKKPVLPLGTDIPEIETFIESIPIESRIWTLGHLYQTSRCRQLPAYVKAAFCDELRLYTEYAISSMYMEAGVVRLLFRFALNALRDEETHIENATDMLTYLRKYFEDNHNYSFNHLTPKLLREWYDLLGYPRKFMICAKNKFIIDEAIPDTALVSLVLRPWQENILGPRITNLKKFGYETVP